MIKTKKTNKKELIVQLTQAIKRDSPEKIKPLIDENPWLLKIKNKKQENLLTQAINLKLKNTINYFLTNHPETIVTKQINNLVLLAKNETILEENIEAIKNIPVEIFETSMFATDNQGNNPIMMATKYGNENLLTALLSCTKHIEQLQLQKNKQGQNIAHLAMKHFDEAPISLINKLKPETLISLDNINGYSAFMIAAYKQPEKQFKAVYNKIKHPQTSFLGDTLLHFSAHNRNEETAIFILNTITNENKANKVNQTPFSIAIKNNNIKTAKSIALKNDITEEELIILSRKPSFFKEEIKNTFEKINISQETTRKIILNVFSHGTFEDIDNLLNINECEIIYETMGKKEILYQIIQGRKEILEKIDFVISDKITAEETIYLCQLMKKLPKQQIEQLINFSNIITTIPEEHLSLIKSVCLVKNIDDNITITTKTEEKNIQDFILFQLKTIQDENITISSNDYNEWKSIILDKAKLNYYYGRNIAKFEKPFSIISKNLNEITKNERANLAYNIIKDIFKKEDFNEFDTLNLIFKNKNVVSKIAEHIINEGGAIRNPEVSKFLIQHNLIKPENNAINTLNEKNISYNIKLINNETTIDKKNVTRISKIFSAKEINTEEIDWIVKNIKNGKDIIKKIIEEKITNDKNVSNTLMAQLTPKETEHILLNNDILGKITENNKTILDMVCEKETIYEKALQENHIFVCNHYLETNHYDQNTTIDIELLPINTETEYQTTLSFLKKAQYSLSKEQITKIFENISQKMTHKSPIQISKDLLDTFDKNIDKIEDSILIKITTAILNKTENEIKMLRMISKNEFDSIFEIIADANKKTVIDEIKTIKNFSLLEKDIQNKLNFKSLHLELDNKPNKEKRIKI